MNIEIVESPERKKMRQRINSIRDGGYCGTSSWHRLTLYRRVVFSDCCAEMAESVHAYWLMDLIAMECEKIRDKFPSFEFCAFEIVVDDDQRACYCASDGNDLCLCKSKHLDYVDLPVGAYKFFCSQTERNIVTVIFPEEY